MTTARSFTLLVLALLGPVACAGTVAGDEQSLATSNAVSATEPSDALSAPSGAFSLSLATAAPAAVNLGEKVSLDVTVTPNGAFAGAVDVSLAGLTPGVAAAPVSVDLANGPAHATLVVAADVTANVTPKDTSAPITITGKSGAETASLTASFKVMPNLVIHIPRGVAALYSAPGGPLRAEWGEAFGPNNKPLRTQANNPIVISIFNDDTTAHVIHGPGGSFPHGDLNAPIQPNAFEMKSDAVRTRTMNVGDNATAYIHGEPNSQNASFKIVIAAAQ